MRRRPRPRLGASRPVERITAAVRVQNRHIINVQGYDPRGLAQYYRMFRTELRKFARLYGMAATTSRPPAANSGEIASWSVETQAAGVPRHRLPLLCRELALRHLHHLSPSDAAGGGDRNRRDRLRHRNGAR